MLREHGSVSAVRYELVSARCTYSLIYLFVLELLNMDSKMPSPNVYDEMSGSKSTANMSYKNLFERLPSSAYLW